MTLRGPEEGNWGSGDESLSGAEPKVLEFLVRCRAKGLPSRCRFLRLQASWGPQRQNLGGLRSKGREACSLPSRLRLFLLPSVACVGPGSAEDLASPSQKLRPLPSPLLLRGPGATGRRALGRRAKR